MTTYYDPNKKAFEKPEDAPVAWRPSAYGILENEKGEWLMVEPTIAKGWDFPGGGVEEEESILEGIAREFYEETGYRVKVDNQPLFVGENNFCLAEKSIFYHVIIFVYRVQLENSERDADVVNTIVPDEIADMQWVNPDTLNHSNVNPPVARYLEFLQK